MIGRYHKQPWRTRARGLLLVVATIAMVLCAQVTRIVAAGLHYGSMQCCCGVHQSDQECGCPDCPAVHHDTDHDDDVDGDSEPKSGAPSMNRCGPTATVVALMAEVPWLPTLDSHDVLTVTVDFAVSPPTPMLSLLQRAPDAPPPRRV